MFTLPQLKGTANFCQQVWQRELCVPPQHQAYSFRSHLYRERLRLAKNLYKYDLRAHFGCVNAVEFSKCGQLLASAGDDKRILLWNVEKAIANIQRPQVMATEHSSNIFCLGFDSKNKRLLSGGNDDIVIGHDIETLKLLNVYKHDSPIYGLSIDATCDHVFATASENGQVLLFDDRINSADPTVIAETNSSFQAVEFHPLSGLYLVTANARRGAAFFDIRKPQIPVVKYGLVHDPHSCMSVRFNSTGNYVLALSRRRAPVLYRSDNAEPVATFFHAQYYNSCTMKSCTFAGEDDEFILSGSDDFNLYAWRIDGLNLESYGQWVESAHMVLHGHRSIVNQVRYNKQKCLLASSGVEKIVKLWSPFEQKGWTGSLTREATCAENARELYLHIPNNILASPHSWSHMSHDYSSRNTNEDPRMMAFFDALIQQEIEDWEMTSYSTDSQDQETAHNSSANLPSTESSSSLSSSSECDDDDDGDHDTGRAAISSRLRNVDVPSALEAQETEPCRENNRRNNSNHCVRSSATERLRNGREHNNRIAYLISTKRNYLRRLAKRGMKRKSCSCTAAKYVKKEFPNPPRILRQTFLRIPHFNRVNQRRFMDNVLRFKRNRSNNGQRLRAHKLFRVRMPTPCPASSSEESLSGTGSSSISSSSSSTNILDNDDLKNPLPSTSSRAIRSTQANSAATPSTSTGHTSSLADIVRLRQNQQQILGTDDETESDDNDLARIALTRSRLRDEVREVIPQKKLNGVRRLNDELTGARLSNRIQAVIEQHNVSNVNNNAWITNTLRRAYDEDFLDVENSSINTLSQTNDIQSNGTTRASTPKTRRKNLRNRCESPVDIVDSEQESKETNLTETQTQKNSKRKRSQPLNTGEIKKSKRRLKSIETRSTTPSKETESIQSFNSKPHKCSKHREIKPQSELKAKKSPNCLKKKSKDKFVNAEKLKTRKKRARKSNVSSDQSSHKLSDDQPSTSAAARAALSANGDLNNELEDSNETSSNFYRNFNNCVKGGSETNDEYKKKVERVKRVCAKNNESDSD